MYEIEEVRNYYSLAKLNSENLQKVVSTTKYQQSENCPGSRIEPQSLSCRGNPLSIELNPPVIFQVCEDTEWGKLAKKKQKRAWSTEGCPSLDQQAKFYPVKAKTQTRSLVLNIFHFVGI